MNIIFTVLFALPIGYFVKQRGLAVVAYLAVDAIVFGFQSVTVLLDWLSNSPPVAFGPSPTGFPITYSSGELLAYGVVNLIVIAVGVGLTVLGTVIAKRRSVKREAVLVG